MLTILWQRSVSLLLPSTCLSCESDLPALPIAAELGLCHGCRQRVRWRSNPEYLSGDVEALYAAAEFSGAFRDVILHFKYQRRDFLAEDFAEQWLARTPFEPDDYDIVAAVPPSPFKSLVRGYNPPEEVAKLIACSHGKPYVSGALRRNMLSTSQTNKSKAQRLKNAQKGFRAGGSRSKIRGKSVLLVDDVCTTGATLGECARLLKRLGARRVLGAALARDLLA